MPQQNNLQIAFCVLRNDSSNACLQTNLYGSAVWKKRFVLACGRRLFRANKPTGGVLRQRIVPNLQRNLGAHSHKSKNIVSHKFCQAICVFCCLFLSVFVLRSDQTCNAGKACFRWFAAEGGFRWFVCKVGKLFGRVGIATLVARLQGVRSRGCFDCAQHDILEATNNCI